MSSVQAFGSYEDYFGAGEVDEEAAAYLMLANHLGAR